MGIAIIAGLLKDLIYKINININQEAKEHIKNLIKIVFPFPYWP